MIVDRLALAERYQSLLPGLAGGFAFLRRADLAELPDGEYPIDGQRIFAVVARGCGRGRQAAPLEVHRRYVDIQYVVTGCDQMGWQPLADCTRPAAAFDLDRDIGFFEDPPRFWFPLPAGQFAIFFPEDVHAPLAGHDPIHKVIIKVALP